MKNMRKIITGLLFLCLPLFYANAQQVPSKAITSDGVRDQWNLGIGYDAKGNNYAAYALDLKTITAVSDTSDNGSSLKYTIIEDRYQAIDTDFLGVDLGLSVKTPFVNVSTSGSMDIVNSIKTSKNSLTMIITFKYVKESLDVSNDDFSEAARKYYSENSKEAFIAKYGDRYLDLIQIGGCLNFVYRLSVSENSKLEKFKLKAACQVMVNNIFKGNLEVDNENITQEEMAQIITETEVFCNGLPWNTEVRNYDEYCDLRDNFLQWLESNSVVVKRQFKKYNELAFNDNMYYSSLNEWYRLREMVQAAKEKAQDVLNWDMQSVCDNALYEINTTISDMKPDDIPMPPTLSKYKEILDYLYDDNEQLARSKAVPVGTVISFLGDGSRIPIGWLLCDGSPLAKENYSELYDILGDTYTTVETGSDLFNLPDLRGQFLRGLDTSGTVDPDGSGRTIGSKQEDELKEHSHRVHGTDHRKTPAFVDTSYDEYGSYKKNHTSTANTGGSETRPKNVAVNFIIKY